MNITSDGWVRIDIINSVVVESYHVPFGFNDNKGRAIGCQITIKYHENVERGPSDYGFVCRPEQLGPCHYAIVHVTRNGKCFGGSNASNGFIRTIEEAKAWVGAAIERCHRANAKKFAK